MADDDEDVVVVPTQKAHNRKRLRTVDKIGLLSYRKRLKRKQLSCFTKRGVGTTIMSLTRNGVVQVKPRRVVTVGDERFFAVALQQIL